MPIIEFEQLYKTYEKELYAFVYSIARKNKHAAEDIMQSTMLNVYKYLHTLKNEYKIRSWIFAIAKREAHKYYSENKAKSKVIVESIETISETKIDELFEPDFSTEIIGTEDFLIAISELSINEQSILFLRYKFGMKLSEIASMWGVNNNTVKTMHFRSIKKLRESFISKGYDFE